MCKPNPQNKSSALSALSLTCVILVLPAVPLPASSATADDHEDLPPKISGALILYRPFVWVGEIPPPDNESSILLACMQAAKRSGIGSAGSGIEEFIRDFPQSAWVPALRANLGRYYYEHGRYSKALAHWELA